MRSETARMLTDSLARIIAQAAPSVSTDEEWAEAAPNIFAMAHEAGLLQAIAPEDHGGLGLPLSDIAVVPRLWGRHGVPLPIVEPLLVSWISALCDLPEDWRKATIALAEPGFPVEAPHAAGNDRLLVLDEDQMLHGYRMDTAAAYKRDLTGQTYIGIPDATQEMTLPLPASLDAARLRTAGSLLSAAALLGALEQVRDIAIDYAQVRMQFGSPLSRFQSIQKMLSEIAAEVEASRAILEQALTQYDLCQSSTLPILSAKARAAQAATLVAAHAHQILGAIGYTEEHHLHRSTKRLWAWRDAWTWQRQEEDAVGALILAGGGDGLWPLLSGTP